MRSTALHLLLKMLSMFGAPFSLFRMLMLCPDVDIVASSSWADFAI
jgi:hypothetical protein